MVTLWKKNGSYDYVLLLTCQCKYDACKKSLKTHMSSVFLANNLPNEEHENILKLPDCVDKEYLKYLFLR